MVIFSGFLSAGDGKEVFLGNTSIEGMQSSADTFEGILKTDVTALQLGEGAETMLDFQLEEFCYADLELQEHFMERGEWNFAFPVTARREEVQEYALNEQENGFGVETVTVTPYEIRVKTILPSGSAAEDDNYGLAVFDQDGKRMQVYRVQESEQGSELIYLIEEKKIEELHLYIGEGDIDCFKETDEAAMEVKALFQTKVIL